ncbi:unnamed protein product [Kluyveromyces dobzhanskii CBS 2104]|uniref:WGS project CCBQ000000000 data, contig 00017 n=1 Tax=Kluyveromyces dobzhanskii CBS 2104 TaxID=1427455 RepID=A0A0A8L926_9SACH|nr:unnamed protein product [Kluyveromyces dobzhanskii CBS 2104]
MQDHHNRIRPASPLSGQRSLTQGNTRRLWVRLDVSSDGVNGNEPVDDILCNQPTSVEIEVRDIIDDVKSKILKKLGNTRWVRFKDNTNVTLGFFYYSDELLDLSQINLNASEVANPNTFTITYTEYIRLIKRNNIQIGRWSQLHTSFNRLLHRSSSPSAPFDSVLNKENGTRMLPPQQAQHYAGESGNNVKYTYKIIIEPDLPVMTVYRELYGSLQRSEDAITLFYSPTIVNSVTPTELLTPSDLLDPIRIFTNDSFEQSKSVSISDGPGTETDSATERQDNEHPSLFGSISSSRNNTNILLLPKGFAPEDVQVNTESPTVELKNPSEAIEYSPPNPEDYTLTTDKQLTEEEVGVSLTSTISSPELPRPLSRIATPALDKPENLPKNKVFPRINVLIVEDNAINQAILALFLRKNGISYKVAKDGLEAIEKWKEGDSHLILMDLQLPLLSGLEATKKIRKLERINKIDIFSQKTNTKHPNRKSHIDHETHENLDARNTEEEDTKLDKSKFRSPVIIVALTASYAQSDRTEALLAGCNDYLTKPVNLDWLSKKITEWGCMQALIDFDGWTEGQRRMTDNVVLRPQISTTRKSQVTSTRSIPRAPSIASSIELGDAK